MKNLLYLAQTDTTIGFISQDATKIDQAKKRLPNKHYIRTVNSLATLQKFSRVPNRHKNRVRRSKQTTFIIPNGLSFRVIKECEHNLLLDRLEWAYSSSANLSGAEYEEVYARAVVEVVVASSLKAKGKASTIYRLGTNGIQFIR